MKISEDMVREVVAEILGNMETAETAKSTKSPLPSKAAGVNLTEVGSAKTGQVSDEIVIAVGPAFATHLTKNLVGLDHATILREVMAGVEEEGLTSRIVKMYGTADVGFMGHQAAQLSGSGIGIGIQSKGTVVIHQKDLNPLANLELFPQAPLVDAETFRAIGKNTARYAKGENPDPVPTRNDQMARPKYQAKAAVVYNKEVKHLAPDRGAVELEVRFE